MAMSDMEKAVARAVYGSAAKVWEEKTRTIISKLEVYGYHVVLTKELETVYRLANAYREELQAHNDLVGK